VRRIAIVVAVLALVASMVQTAVAAPRQTALKLSAPSRGTKALPKLAHPGRDDLYKSLARGDLSEGQYALQRALSLFRFGRVDARFGRVVRPSGHDATAILRDLAFRVDDLSGAELALAKRILARPGEKNSINALPSAQFYGCSTHVCIHWTDTGPDAPDLTDSDADGVPDYVETASSVFEEVWTTEVDQMGYRAPLPDIFDTGDRVNPDTRLDVYLFDLGNQSLYGYCQAEPDPATTYFASPAFCAVDDDFDISQFPAPGVNGIPALQVTAAHEFFHAVQFAYDALEDRWFLEGTAAWMEDQVYDEINDNLQYLGTSAIPYPEVPVDYGDEGFQYGSFLFFRFLSETFDQDLIKEAWLLADGSGPTAPDFYSSAAIAAALEARGSNFGPVFADFAAFNYIPDEFYEEGDTYVQQVGYPPGFGAKLTKNKPIGVGKFNIDHLSTIYGVLRPGKGISNSARLKIKLNLPDVVTGSWGTAVVVKRSGGSQVVPINLNNSGGGTVTVPFGKNNVLLVGVAMTNASIRFSDCYAAGSPFSCAGIPTDDGRLYKIRATAQN
jgi:hypothetical protein